MFRSICMRAFEKVIMFRVFQFNVLELNTFTHNVINIPHIYVTNFQDLRADVVPRDESVPVPAHPYGTLLLHTAFWHPRTSKSFLLSFDNNDFDQFIQAANMF